MNGAGDTMSMMDPDLYTDTTIGGGTGVDYEALKTLPGLRAVENWTIDADEGVSIYKLLYHVIAPSMYFFILTFTLLFPYFFGAKKIAIGVFERILRSHVQSNERSTGASG